MDTTKRGVRKCIFFDGKWHTPSEFESLGGKKAKKWKQSLLHLGKQICEYDLSTSTAGVSPSTSVVSGSDSCRQPVSAVSAGDASVVSENVSSQPTMSDGNPPVVDVSTLYGSDIVSDHSCASDVNGSRESSFIVDPVLSFIKAFRLKGDNETLRNVIMERFSSADIEKAKKLL